MYYKTKYKSPIGIITMACDSDENLVGLWIEGQKYFEDSIKSEITVDDTLEVFQKTKNWLEKYFNGDKPAISELPLAPIGTEFRQKVWQILCKIPYGEVCSYGDIARQLGKRMSAQAVGGAVGHNPISIIIPCHRVVGSNGDLTGYSGGVEIKARLLRHEGAIV